MESLLQDLRYSIRAMIKRPTINAVAVKRAVSWWVISVLPWGPLPAALGSAPGR